MKLEDSLGRTDALDLRLAALERRVLALEDAAPRMPPPTLAEVAAYVKEKGYSVDPAKFHAHYEATGWRRGGVKIVKWRAVVATWHLRDLEAAAGPSVPRTKHVDSRRPA